MSGYRIGSHGLLRSQSLSRERRRPDNSCQAASSLAGLLVTQSAGGYLEHYERLGYVVSAAVTMTIVLMRRIDVMVMRDALAKEG